MRACGLILICFAMLLPSLARAEAWTVVLTARQAAGFADLTGVARNNAMAISPDGAWGFSEGYDTAAQARTRALQYCRGFLKPGRRDCILFAVNGARVAPQVVETRIVSQVYSPIDGKRAGAFFGRAAISFQGSRPQALAELRAIQDDAEMQARLPKNKGLKARLTGTSLMLTGRRGFAIYLGDVQAWHYAQANSGILRKRFGAWYVTPSGLLCLQYGVWENTGQDDGTRCVILSDFAQGGGTMSWDGTPRTKRKAQLIAGDARFGAAK